MQFQTENINNLDSIIQHFEKSDAITKLLKQQLFFCFVMRVLVAIWMCPKSVTFFTFLLFYLKISHIYFPHQIQLRIVLQRKQNYTLFATFQMPLFFNPLDILR